MGQQYGIRCVVFLVAEKGGSKVVCAIGGR
jgi:hypothetical protein